MIRSACLRYFYEFVCIVMIFIILALLLDYFTDYNLADYAYSLCFGVVIWPAMRTGTYWYNEHDDYPANKVMWQLAVCFSLIVCALVAILFWLLLRDGSQYKTSVESLATLGGMKTLGISALVVLLFNRFGFSLGILDAKRQAKSKLAKEKLAQQKLTEKSGE